MLEVIYMIQSMKAMEKNAECKCHSPKEWEQLSDTPIAWLILTHNDITMERSISLLHRIWRMHHKYVIHVDKSVSHASCMLLVEKINNQFSKHDNIFVISEAKGGYRYELVEIELELLRTVVNPWPTLFEMDHYYHTGSLPNISKSSESSINADGTCRFREWEYAAILSGDSYPLQDIDVIVRRISRRSPSVNRLGGVGVDGYRTYHRIVKSEHGKEILKVLETAYRECGDNEKANKLKGINTRSKAYNAPVYWGIQWIVLTRSFAEYSLSSEFAHRLFEAMKHVKYAGDEAYFQSLLYASCRNDLIWSVNNSSIDIADEFMYTTWTSHSEWRDGRKRKLSSEWRPEDMEMVFRDRKSVV